MLGERLSREWPLEVRLGTPGSRLLENASYAVELGTDLDFQVTSERSASLAVVHLGSDDVITLIYPSPLGVTPQLGGKTRTSVGAEIGLTAREPLGEEWFLFVASENLPLPPPMPGVQNVGTWAAVYPLGEQHSPGEKLALWLADTFSGSEASANLLQIEVVAGESAP